MNLSQNWVINVTQATNPRAYIPDQQAVNWCIQTQIVEYNNAEVMLMLVFFLAYVCLWLSVLGKEFPGLKVLSYLDGIARNLILGAILVWLLFFHYRLIPFFTL